MSKYTTEVVRRIYDDQEGVAMEVGVDSDSLGFVEVRTKDEAAENHWGKVRFSMHPAMARQMGAALLACADEVEKLA